MSIAPIPSIREVIIGPVIGLSRALLMLLINSLLIWITFRFFKITYSRKRFVSFLFLVNIFSFFYILLMVSATLNVTAEDSSPTFFELVNDSAIWLAIWFVLTFFFIRGLLKKFFEMSTRRNIISLIIAAILFPVFSGYIAGKLISLVYVRNNVSDNYERVCPFAPGALTITLKDTISLTEAEVFIQGDLIDRWGFVKADVYIDTSPQKSQSHRMVKLSEMNFEESVRELTNLEDKLQEVVGRLRNDPRVDRVFRTGSYNFFSKLIRVKLREGVRADELINDYPELILFPDYIKFELNDYNLQPGEQIFASVTLTEQLNFLQSLKEEVVSLNPADSLAIAYDAEWRNFEVVFPAHFSRAEIENLIGDASKNHLFSRAIPPEAISFSLKVPEGEENKWITELGLDGNVQKVEQRHQICPY